MSANYNEQKTSGEMTTWIRAKKIMIDNPLHDVPTLSFIEEEVKSFTDKTVILNTINVFSKVLSDPNETFHLLNPATGEALGMQMSVGQVAAALYSYYIALAKARDEAQATQPTEPETPVEPGE